MNFESLPPAYPFESDELIASTTIDSEWEVGKDSYLSLSKLPEDELHEFNGRVHENTHRLVIHTPEKGSIAFLMNEKDLELLICVLLSGIDDTKGEFNLSWAARLLGDRMPAVST